MYKAPFIALIGLIPYWLALGFFIEMTKRVRLLQWLHVYPIQALGLIIYAFFWITLCSAALFTVRDFSSLWTVYVTVFGIASVGTIYDQAKEVRQLWPKQNAHLHRTK